MDNIKDYIKFSLLKFCSTNKDHKSWPNVVLFKGIGTRLSFWREYLLGGFKVYKL